MNRWIVSGLAALVLPVVGCITTPAPAPTPKISPIEAEANKVAYHSDELREIFGIDSKKNFSIMDSRGPGQPIIGLTMEGTKATYFVYYDKDQDGKYDTKDSFSLDLRELQPQPRKKTPKEPLPFYKPDNNKEVFARN